MSFLVLQPSQECWLFCVNCVPVVVWLLVFCVSSSRPIGWLVVWDYVICWSYPPFKGAEQLIVYYWITIVKVKQFVEIGSLTNPCNTVKPVLGGHSKIDKTKVLKTNGSLMKVESIAECILQYFWPALSDNRSWKPILIFFLSGRLRQVLLYLNCIAYFRHV